MEQKKLKKLTSTLFWSSQLILVVLSIINVMYWNTAIPTWLFYTPLLFLIGLVVFFLLFLFIIGRAKIAYIFVESFLIEPMKVNIAYLRYRWEKRKQRKQRKNDDVD